MQVERQGADEQNQKIFHFLIIEISEKRVQNPSCQIKNCSLLSWISSFLNVFVGETAESCVYSPECGFQTLVQMFAVFIIHCILSKSIQNGEKQLLSEIYSITLKKTT